MAGDFSRNTFDPSRHFSGVLMQQGRVLVDAEWNEQIDIQQHRDLKETRDVIGLCGTPKDEDGFYISQTPTGDDLLIASGRYYVDGLLCELDGISVPITIPASGNQKVVVPYLYLDGYDLAIGQWVEIGAAKNPLRLFTKITGIDPSTPFTLTVDADVTAYRNVGAVTLRRAVTYTTQPDYPTPKTVLSSPPHSPSGGIPVSLSDGDYLIYLVAWQREVNALEDPRIREVALGGPDTTERRQTVWQVRFLPVSSAASPHFSPHISSPPELAFCCDAFPEWKRHIAPPTGTMNAQTVPPTGDQDLCSLPPTAGYQRLENQLYRIEVFRGDDTLAKSRFVWSRDNASFQTTIVGIAGFNVTLTSLGKDDYFSFASGQWVEISYPESELGGEPRFLAQITGPPDTSGPNPIITLNQSPNFTQAEIPQLRLVRWDMTDPSVTTSGIPMQAGWMNIEAGIQVQFSEGSYRTGDFWEIPARTAVGDIEWPPFEVPNANPVPQCPQGIQRHYCCLAHLNVSSGAWSITDCRKKFPPLSHICADDICYQGTCDLPGITTVQDAIDQLCQQSDLRFHNRHLHGWGIVCGLKVTCGPDNSQKPRRHVTVSSGYAIDCNGNDVILNPDRTIDIMTMVQALPPPPPTSPPSSLVFPDGDYSLILDPSAPGMFRVEEFVPKNFWDDVLNDTLLLDIYNDCVKDLITFLENEFTAPGSSTEPSGPGQRLTTSLVNLLAPYRNADVGGYIFLSGDSNQAVETQYQEDLLLRDFYNKLRQLLQSQTYCAMFDKARPFPGTKGSNVPYPYSGLKISTLFDTDFRIRLRVDPTGARAYAIGTDATIHVFDLNAQKMAPLVTFPDPGAIVQDVAFSPDGKQLYCIASLNNQHTMFASATLSGVQVNWQQQPALIPNVVMVTLGTSSKVPGKVFAIGVGKGLYQFDPQTIATNPAINPVQAFNAFGHMSIDDRSATLIASALSAQTQQPPTAFDRVLMFNVIQVAAPSSYPLTGGQGTADDDILVFQAGKPQAGGPDLTRIAIVYKVPSLTTKQLLILDLTEFRQQITVGPIILTETSAVKLAFNQTTSFLMLTMLNNCRIMLVDPAKLVLEQNVFPVQISPLGIVAITTANSSFVYVLNNISKTISAYSADLLTPAKQPDLPSLLAYHTAAIDSFWDLLGGFTEYLKDCICEHLLIDCPSCDQDDELFLGVVSIRQKQVFKICNLMQRKYLKSFPTVGYWLSAIPIVPIIGKLIEIGCCQALPDLFAKYSAPQPSNSVIKNPSSGNGFAVNSKFDAAQGAVMLFHQSTLQGLTQATMTRIMPTGQFFTDFLASKSPAISAPLKSIQAVQNAQIVGTSADLATSRLQSAGVNVVNVVHYDPTSLGQNIAASSIAPPSIPAGEGVSLVVNDQNQVVYYTRTSADVVALHSQVQASQQQIKQTADAVNQMSALSQQLQASVNSAQQTLTASQPALTAAAALQSRVANLENLTAAQQSALDAAKPLQTMVASLTSQLAAQQAANTQALAARDKQIADLTTQAQTLQTQLQQLSAHLPNTPSTGGPAKG